MSDSPRLSGTTWNVYLYILTSQPQGVRDVWRGLDLSSPSLAQYHINKLVELGLIESTPDGRYQTTETTQLKALRSFMILRGKLIPRLVFYGGLLLGVFVIYVLLWPFRWDFRDVIFLTIFVFSISIFFYEASVQYKSIIE